MWILDLAGVSSTPADSGCSTSVEHVLVCSAPGCDGRWGAGKRMFISLADALTHRCESFARSTTEPDRFEFAYSTRASAAVKHILSLLKVSPPTTAATTTAMAGEMTATELDRIDGLFVCCKCNPRVRVKDGAPLTSFDVFTWREAVRRTPPVPLYPYKLIHAYSSLR